MRTNEDEEQINLSICKYLETSTNVTLEEVQIKPSYLYSIEEHDRKGFGHMIFPRIHIPYKVVVIPKSANDSHDGFNEKGKTDDCDDSMEVVVYSCQKRSEDIDNVESKSISS